MVENSHWFGPQGLHRGEVNKRQINNTWLQIVSVDTGVSVSNAF